MRHLLTKERFLDEARKRGINVTYRTLRKYASEGIFPQPIKGKRYLGLYKKSWIKELKLIKEAMEKYSMKIKDIRSFKSSGYTFEEYLSRKRLEVLSSNIGINADAAKELNLSREDKILLRAMANFEIHLQFLMGIFNGKVANFSINRQKLVSLLAVLRSGVEVLNKREEKVALEREKCENLQKSLKQTKKNFQWMMGKYEQFFDTDKERRRIMPKKTIREVGRTDILIRNEIAFRFFQTLSIDPQTNYLMDVKRALFRRYNLPEPEITIRNPRKTLAEQRPNNAYGIPITEIEKERFVEMFGLSQDDEYSEISHRIERDILGR